MCFVKKTPPLHRSAGGGVGGGGGSRRLFPPFLFLRSLHQCSSQIFPLRMPVASLTTDARHNSASSPSHSPDRFRVSLSVPLRAHGERSRVPISRDFSPDLLLLSPPDLRRVLSALLHTPSMSASFSSSVFHAHALTDIRGWN